MSLRRALALVGAVTLLTAVVATWIGSGADAAIVEDHFQGVAIAERWWRWHGAAGLSVAEGRAILETEPPRTAYLEASFLGAPIPPRGARSRLRRLLGRAPDARYTERLEVRAAVRRTGPYLVLVEAWFDTTLLWVQLTDSGIHITFPGERGERTGHEVHDRVGQDPGVHSWRIERDESAVTLIVDGSRLWSAPARGPMTRLRLGDEAVDSDHRGTIELDAVRYERRAAAPRV